MIAFQWNACSIIWSAFIPLNKLRATTSGPVKIIDPIWISNFGSNFDQFWRRGHFTKINL